MSGNIVIKPQFDYVGAFIEELAPVLVNEKWGYLDNKGKVVIPAQYQFTNGFSEGLACVETWGKSGYINTKGDWIWKPTR